MYAKLYAIDGCSGDCTRTEAALNYDYLAWTLVDSEKPGTAVHLHFGLMYHLESALIITNLAHLCWVCDAHKWQSSVKFAHIYSKPIACRCILH